MLNKTKHVITRANQRGIKEVFVNLVYLLGIEVDDKKVLTKKQCQALSSALMILKKHIDKIAEKGGYIQVIDADTLITMYRANSFCYKKSKFNGACSLF